MKRRQWVGLGFLAALVVVTVVLTGPATSSEKGPGGTLALRRLLAGMGHQVRDADAPPQAPAVFVLLADLRGPEEADDLLGWARTGGTLIIAGPSSATLAVAGIKPGGRVGGYAFGPAELGPGCVAGETVGIRRLAVDATDNVLKATNAGAAGCFATGGGHFEISMPVGSGRLIALGGISPFTNALLSAGDNAAFADGLFGSGGPVVFGPVIPAGTESQESLWSALPAAARLVIVQIVLAALAFALMRGRRLGRPVAENIPSPVPASELVEATGRLYRSARASAFAGETLRRATVGRLRGRLGLGPALASGPGAWGRPAVDPAEEESLSSTLAGLSGGEPDRVRRLLAGPPPTGDQELIALGRELEELRRRVEGSWV